MEKGLGSFWLGVKRIDGVWYKSNKEKLSPVDLDIIDKTAEGDCMIIDTTQGFRGKIVSCTESYPVSKQAVKSLCYSCIYTIDIFSDNRLKIKDYRDAIRIIVTLWYKLQDERKLYTIHSVFFDSTIKIEVKSEGG